jgi:hypothetical protein
MMPFPCAVAATTTLDWVGGGVKDAAHLGAGLDLREEVDGKGVFQDER